MKKLLILIFILIGCVPTKIVQKPFEECPATDMVVIGDYFGTVVPFKMKKGYFNDPNAAYMTLDEFIKIMKDVGMEDKIIND